jgi:cellulose synthase operon protein C
MSIARTAAALVLGGILVGPASALAQDAGVPEVATPSSAVLEAATAAYMTAEERKDFRVRHGISNDLDLDNPVRRALVALERWRLDDPVLAEPGVPEAYRLEALARMGRHGEIVAATEGADALTKLAFRARALAALGRSKEAEAIVRSDRARDALDKSRDIDEILAAVDMGELLIRLDARSAGDFPRLLGTLARARQEIDRLDPRVRLREAQLLAERHAVRDALQTLGEAMALNPRSAEGWRLAGTLAVDRFDFAGAANAAAALRRLDAAHPLAAFVETASLLVQDDVAAARAAIEPVLARADRPVEALAWKAAVEGSGYDFDAMRATLEACDRLEPASAAALVVCGRQLAFDRQYAEAREILSRAADREPAWALPRAELGLLSMQDGREERAVADLRAAVSLDPNDERTAFTLKLAEQLASWNRIETQHFVIRHPDGDAALVAKLLEGTLDRMHGEVCGRIGHEPPQKTIIDVMPDHRSFGVRITGLPRIHTIAVCTGPTIAIEIPKDGPQQKHLGLFDPLAVLRHEYTHTVTLSMTRNRIPHWLTEAVAVTLEDTPRTYETCQMLAAAWRGGTLFDLEAINWGFVRPRKPTDRAQAYAQGRWMIEFIERTYGWDALRKLLFSYAGGIREEEAMQQAFGVGRAEFFQRFTRWAGGEVGAWGLDPSPAMRDLRMRLVAGDDSAESDLRAAGNRRMQMVARAWADAIGRPGSDRFKLRAGDWPARPMPNVDLDDATARAFLAEFPDQPDLVELLLRRARGTGASDTAEARQLLERYAKLRPVDPLPHRVWARLATDASGNIDAGGDESALFHLRELDIRSDKDNIFALAIARNRRVAGDLPAALESAERAVRMNPFDAPVRELAAAIAVEAHRYDQAEIHIEALVALEPDRAVHRQRLERIRALGAQPKE